MAQQLILPEEELERKVRAIRTLSLGVLFTAVAGGISAIIIWLLNRDYSVIPIIIVAVSVMLTGLLTYWLVRAGRVKFTGYFFIISLTVVFSVATYLFGGAAGPVAVTFILPILAASMVIGSKSTFVVATIASVLFLAIFVVEMSGFFPQVIAGEWHEIAGGSTKEILLAYIAIPSKLIFFYLIAFLSWFTFRWLHQALNSVSRYAAKLQTANEKLQASEEELRASNEELEASNEELRATEEELRSSNEELESANEELKQAQEQLVRSEKLAAIGQLAGGVGHELRNPLGAIKNAVYYIRGKAGKSDLAQNEPRVMEFLDIVDDEINSSNKIINDLLGFSRVGKPSVSPAKIDKVINDALTHTPVPENIGIDKNVDASLPEVEIDTDQIRQVLVNMITNAVQAMPEGGKLTLEARKKDSFLEMKIADTGVGMSEEITGKIFDPLYTTRAKGIGLGLAVCKSIIDRHEGQVKVESSVGKGTTFTIKLPLKAG